MKTIPPLLLASALTLPSLSPLLLLLLSKYGTLCHDLKACITSAGVVDVIKPLRPWPRTQFLKSTVFPFGALDPMAARLFFNARWGMSIKTMI
jgi:hypothetical protein